MCPLIWGEEFHRRQSPAIFAAVWKPNTYTPPHAHQISALLKMTRPLTFSFVLLLVTCSLGQKQNLIFESPLYVINLSGVTKVAIHQNKAFVLVPSAPVPLLEVSWMPGIQHVSKLRKTPINASVRRCQGLVRPVDLLVDPYSRLWLLDAGDEKCAAKIVIYDILMHRLAENARHTFALGEKVEYLAVDPGSSRSVTMAYVAGPDQIYVYSYYQDRHWPVRTIINDNITGITVSYGGANLRTTLLVLVSHETVYQIFTSNLLDKEAGVLELGSLMGPSLAGMVSDGRGGIIYMLSRDFVAVKWSSNLPLRAENQDILLQSDRVLFNTTSFVMDSNKNVWAVVNNGTNAEMTWCTKLTLSGF